MSDLKPLPSGARMSDATWPGVVAALPCGLWRVAVNSSGSRYALQRRLDADGAEIWAGRSFARLAGLVASSFASAVPGLADACRALPDDPADARPVLRASLGLADAVRQSRDWRREDYARCIVTDGNLRLVVEPDGSAYRLQWTSTVAARRVAYDWRTLARCECLDDVRAALLCAYNVDGAGPVAPDLRAALASLPERAALGSWPVLPAPV